MLSKSLCQNNGCRYSHPNDLGPFVISMSHGVLDMSLGKGIIE